MGKRILLVGGGGHCKSVLDSLFELNEFSEIGIIEKEKPDIKKDVLGVPVIGCDRDLLKLFNSGYKYAFVTVGSTGSSELRVKLFNKLDEIGFEIPNIIDRSAVVSRNVDMEIGIFVGKNAVINAGSRIHKGAVINTGAIIEHDCTIGEFTNIAPGSVLNGEVEVGANTFIGANSVIKQQLRIGSNSIIGMGSVVLKDIKDNVIAYGSPCRGVRTR